MNDRQSRDVSELSGIRIYFIYDRSMTILFGAREHISDVGEQN